MTSRSQRETTGRIDARAFALTCGVLWSIGVACIAVLARFGWAERWRRLLADAYLGYGESPGGIAIGATWAFFDAAIGGYAFARLYNRLS